MTTSEVEISPNAQAEAVNTICAIMVGKAANSQEAAKLVKAAKSCPYVSFYTAKDSTVMGIFCLPKNQREWLEYPTEQPRILQLEPIMTIVTDEIMVSSPFSRGEVKPEAEETPCNKKCDKCPHYKDSCHGCPATIFFYAAE
jgi:hypothetical protein